jgi:hypothetical protein
MNMIILFWIWLVITSLMLISGLFLMGYMDVKGESRPGDVDVVLGACVLWPLAVMVSLILSPFYGIMLLGKWAAKRVKK